MDRGVSGDPESVAGEYGRHSLYKMLGYFSLVGLLRLHSLLGDYYQAIKVLENIELNKKVRFCWEETVVLLTLTWCKAESSPSFFGLVHTHFTFFFRVCTHVCLSARSPRITMWGLPIWWWGAIRTPFESLPTSCSTSRGPETCSRGQHISMRWSVTAS